MAWTTPKTDWMDDDLFTYADLNRISSNVNYLYQEANLKVNWVRNDFLDVENWNALLAAMRHLTNYYQLDTPVITSTTLDSSTINAIEQQLAEVYELLDMLDRQHVADIYCGDGIYMAADGQYADVAENYLRGTV